MLFEVVEGIAQLCVASHWHDPMIRHGNSHCSSTHIVHGSQVLLPSRRPLCDNPDLQMIQPPANINNGLLRKYRLASVQL